MAPAVIGLILGPLAETQLRRVLKIDGAGHWGVPSVAGPAYDKAVRDFIVVAGSAAPSAALSSMPTAVR